MARGEHELKSVQHSGYQPQRAAERGTAGRAGPAGHPLAGTPDPPRTGRPREHLNQHRVTAPQVSPETEQAA
jgi:hypothetical protein